MGFARGRHAHRLRLAGGDARLGRRRPALGDRGLDLLRLHDVRGDARLRGGCAPLRDGCANFRSDALALLRRQMGVDDLAIVLRADCIAFAGFVVDIDAIVCIRAGIVVFGIGDFGGVAALLVLRLLSGGGERHCPVCEPPASMLGSLTGGSTKGAASARAIFGDFAITTWAGWAAQAAAHTPAATMAMAETPRRRWVRFGKVRFNMAMRSLREWAELGGQAALRGAPAMIWVLRMASA